jgi:intein/homing endonuclease
MKKLPGTPLCLVQPIPEEVQDYISGLVDGDGCIEMNRKTITVSIGQSGTLKEAPKVLQFMRKWFGGSLKISKSYLKKHPTWRPSYKLRITCREEMIILLTFLERKCALKSPQAKIALVYTLDRGRAISEGKEYDTIYAKTKTTLTSMKKLEAYQNVPIIANRITKAWLAGFFDAEGCVMFPMCLKAQVTQKQSPLILKTIKILRKCGAIHGIEYVVYGKYAEQFLKDILPFSIVKKEQIEIALRIFELQQERISSNSKSQYTYEIRVLALALKALKH